MRGSRVCWLIDNAGPAIRYRTLTEIAGESNGPIVKKSYRELCDSQLVNAWLNHLDGNTDFTGIHNGKPFAFENAVGKLVDLGIRAGFRSFDQRVRPYREWLQNDLRGTQEGPFRLFLQVIVASGLFQAGYNDDAVCEVLYRRLKSVSDFTRSHEYDIHVDSSGERVIPRRLKGRKLLKPEIVGSTVCKVPLLHDLHVLATMYGDADDGNRTAIDSVVGYILDSRYHELPDGYGSFRYGKRLYVMGWDAKLPGYSGLDHTGRDSERLVMALLCMAHFPSAVVDEWCRSALRHLGTFQSDDGCFCFPRTYLQERRTGYWVRGSYMGLEENRRKACAVRLESTFRWLLIRKATEAARLPR